MPTPTRSRSRGVVPLSLVLGLLAAALTLAASFAAFYELREGQKHQDETRATIKDLKQHQDQDHATITALQEQQKMDRATIKTLNEVLRHPQNNGSDRPRFTRQERPYSEGQARLDTRKGQAVRAETDKAEEK
jgi:uncharacterized protein HemX